MRPALRCLAGVLGLAAAYYAAGEASLALQYTGPVAALWLPVGIAAVAVAFGGVRWLPGMVIGDIALADAAQPAGTALAITAGNVADVLVIAWLLRRSVGGLERLEQVGRLLGAIAAGAAISAATATLALLAGEAIDAADVSTVFRSWFLADACGSLVVIPLFLAWRQRGAWGRRGRAVGEGAVLAAAVVGLSALAASSEPALSSLVFAPLIWATLRFGQRGATAAVAIAALTTVWITAERTGTFVDQPITDSALGTQLLIAVAAVTMLCLAVVVAERRRATIELAESRRREEDRAGVERARIARDLHDSVSQSLFSTALHMRSASRALRRDGHPEGAARLELDRARELVGGALAEMRALVFELRPAALAEDGLVVALASHAAAVAAREDLSIGVHGPRGPLPLTPEVEEQLYRLAQEALANVVKHAAASRVAIDVTASDGTVVVTILDDGHGFDPAARGAGGYGLRSMRTRAEGAGGQLDIESASDGGTLVRAEVPAHAA